MVGDGEVDFYNINSSWLSTSTRTADIGDLEPQLIHFDISVKAQMLTTQHDLVIRAQVKLFERIPFSLMPALRTQGHACISC